MTAPDLTEARDLAAMWQARSEAAEAIAAKLARDVWAAIGFHDDPTVDRDLADACGFVGQQARMRFDDLAIGRDNHHTRASIAEAIIRGRSEAPTQGEAEAHEKRGGTWLVLYRSGNVDRAGGNLRNKKPKGFLSYLDILHRPEFRLPIL